MAIVYSYPEGTPTLSDTVLGTQFDNNGNPTKSFSISDIIALAPSTAGFVPYTGAAQSVDLGAFDLTATSIIKAGGTSAQYLMADGSISTAPSLTGFVPYVGATQNVNLGSFNLTATSIVKAGGTNLQYLMADGSVTTGSAFVTSVTGTSPIISSGGTTPAISIPLGTSSVDGYLSATDRTNFQTAYTNRITSLTTTGTGAATLIANVLNIPTPSLSGFVPYTGATGPVDLGAYNLTVNNISVGRGAGTGAFNTVIGASALSSNTTGGANVAVGYLALATSTSGNDNVAIGYTALANNTTAVNNVAIGSLALCLSNYPLVGSNTAVGYNALGNQTSAYNNTAFGSRALQANTTGTYNVGIGAFAFQGVTTGSYNLGVGMSAATGLTTGTQNTHIGHYGNCASNSDTNSTQLGYNVTGSGSNSVTIGNASVTLTRLRGTVQGGSFVKDSGTSFQHLMADGSITTNGTLFTSSSITYQGAAGTLQKISTAIPSSIFTSGDLLKLNAVITTTAVTVAIATIEFYINSAATTVGATLIGRYNGPIGNQYIPVDRFFWVSGTTLYGKDFTASFSTSTSNSAFAINSVAIPATQFYIIAQVTTTSTDRACISSFQIEKS